MKRLLKISLGALAALVLALGAAILLIDVDALVEAKKPELLEKASASLGRTIVVADIDARLLPDFGATLSGVKIEGRTEAEPALLEVGRAELRFSLWKAITSLGKDLEVVALELRDVKAYVARAADGSWSFDDILEREPEQPKEDEGPTDLSFLEGARVERAAILNADITLDDAELGRPLKVEGTSLVLTDVRLGAPLEAKLDTTLVDGQKRTPVSLAVKLAELPRTLSFDPFPELSAALKMSALDVGPWGGLLPRDALAPLAGSLAADLQVDAGRDLTTFTGKGTLKSNALVLGQSGKRGQPLDADVAFDVEADTKAPRYLVRALTVQGTGVDVKGSLEATSESLAGVRTADVQARVQDLKRLLSVLPPGVAALPAELVLAGPIEARLSGNAEAVDLSVNLDKARVAWADAFDKPAGRALHLTLKGKKAGDVLAVEPFTLQVDTARITGKLGLPMNGSAPLTADISSGPVTLSSLQGIIPPFAEALRKGDRVNGTFSLEATAKAVDGKQDARALVSLASVDVNLAEASARGAGKVELVVAPKDGVIDLRTVADLTGLALSSVGEGGAKVLDKPAGLPTRLEIEVTKTDQRADVKQALLAIGNTKLSAKGEATGLDTKAPKLDVDFGNVDVAFDDLRRTLPGASSLPAGGHLRGKVRVTGSPEALSTLEVRAQDVDLAFGSSAVKGQIDLVNLDAPRVSAKLPTLKVAFDDVRALADTDALPAGGRYEGALDVSVNTADLSTLKAELQVSALRVGRSDMAGKASLTNLDRPTFAFDFSGQRVDVDELMKLFGADGEQTAEEKPRPDDNPHGLSRDARAKLRRTNGQGSIRAKSIVIREVPMQDFVGRLTMKNGVAEFDALDFKLYGGAVSAKGTTLDLPAEHTGYGLKLDITRMDLRQALSAHTSLGGVFRGQVSNSIDLQGRGLTKRDLITTLTGPTMWRTDSLTIASLDVLTPIVRALEQASKNVPGAPRIVGQGAQGTTMRDMQAWLRFLGGKMELEKPVTTNTPFGSVTFTGQAFLDSRLDLGATVNLSPATIAQWTRNQVRPSSAIEVPLRIGGTWNKPQVTGVDITKLAQAILGVAVSGALGEVAGAAGEQAEQVLEQVRDQARGVQEEADRRRRQAEEQARKAADDARRAAEEAKRQAEAEAKRKADEARKKAEAAKKKAEEEARKKAAAAKKKAEEEARKKAAAAKKKAEEEARKRLGL